MNNPDDYEGRQLTAFLLGLVLVLSVLLVALEYNSRIGVESDNELLEEIMSESTMMPIMSHVEVTVLPTKEEQAGSRIKVVADKNVEENDTTDDKEDIMAVATLVAGVDSSVIEESDILPPTDGNEDENPLNFRVVEDIPQFPGGTAAFVKWLSKNLRYPPLAQKKGIKGKVAVSFIVEKNGKITDIKLVQPLHPECNEEALRVIRMMPDWTPGKMNGKLCRTMVCVPIVFKM